MLSCGECGDELEDDAHVERVEDPALGAGSRFDGVQCFSEKPPTRSADAGEALADDRSSLTRGDGRDVVCELEREDGLKAASSSALWISSREAAAACASAGRTSAGLRGTFPFPTLLSVSTTTGISAWALLFLG